jgi:hypothetical protein
VGALAGLTANFVTHGETSMPNKTKGAEKREKLRESLFPGEEAWIGEAEKGWFRAPRTLPLILSLIDAKDLSGKVRTSNVYLELWARNMGEGFIEMKEPESHAYFAGYTGSRGVRTWQERMKLLVKTGFIKVKPAGNRIYGYVLLVHPANIIEKLIAQDKLPANWADEYTIRQIETKERTLAERKQEREAAAKVVRIQDSQAAKKKATAH